MIYKLNVVEKSKESSEDDDVCEVENIDTIKLNLPLYEKIEERLKFFCESEKEFIKLNNLDNVKRNLVQTIAAFYGLRHETFNRDCEDCYMLVSKLSYPKDNSNRVNTQSELVKASNSKLAVYENVEEVLKAKSPKRRGRPKNTKSGPIESTNEQDSNGILTKKYNLRRKNYRFINFIFI
ncbi:unnamed protein product [Brachionus calyciflorus]|uniref:Uncharacterized protein n=1 Tax=Brachionus calyciflorus TaxID=104777 RepID=A0A814NLN0_9BILA|nr:unnamed protein product [Brachionus calyciflorus]